MQYKQKRDYRDPYVNDRDLDQTTIYRSTYVGNDGFYTYCLDHLEGPFHFKLKLKPSNQENSLSVHEQKVQDLLDKLNYFNAKEVKKVSNRHIVGKYEVIFTFYSKAEAKAYHEFFKDFKNYSGHKYPDLQRVFLQPGK